MAAADAPPEESLPISRQAEDNPLPRAVTRGGEYALLDGEWRFELDPGDRGLAAGWQRGRALTSRIAWPGAIEAALADVLGRAPGGEVLAAVRWPGPAREAIAEALGRSADGGIVAWYERDFVVPPNWAGRVIQLTFGACGYETRVWLNGHPLVTVEGEEIHVGEYTSFSYELPEASLRPVNRVTVRIHDTLDAETPRGKQASRVYKRGGIWYQTISGPLRSVWLEPLGRNRLRSRLGVRAELESGLVEFTLTTRVLDPGDYTLRLTVTPRDGSPALASAEHPLRLEPGERRQRVTLALPGATPWSPRQPTRYTLDATLVDPGGTGSAIRAAFGLRKIERRGGRVFLNNHPLYLDGILYQPGIATYAEMRRHLRAIKDLGCNLVRIHIAGIDPRIYELADELGLLVWVEVPSPHSSTERSRANHRAELLRMLPWAGHHPSVAIWSLYNEDWGAEDIAASAATRAYIATAREELRRHLPQVLIVDNDGWNHVSVEGALQSDLLTAHIYATTLDAWRDTLDRLVAGDLDRVAVKPLVVGDPFFYAGQVPLVVSEWGGFGFALYGGPAAATGRARLIRAFKRALRDRGLAGDVYTQATDIEDEVNGLIDAATGALRVPAGILGGRSRAARAADPAAPETDRHAPPEQPVLPLPTMERLVFPTGAVIVRQGTAGERFYIVLDGEVAVLREEGDQIRQIATLGRGQFFGEMALVGSTPRTATVRAITPTTVLTLERDGFRALIAQSLDGAADFDRIIRERFLGQGGPPAPQS